MIEPYTGAHVSTNASSEAVEECRRRWGGRGLSAWWSTVLVADLVQDSDETGAEDQPYPISDAAARSKGLRIPAPKVSGKPEMYTTWKDSFLDYADFHASVGC